MEAADGCRLQAASYKVGFTRLIFYTTISEQSRSTQPTAHISISTYGIFSNLVLGYSNLSNLIPIKLLSVSQKKSGPEMALILMQIKAYIDCEIIFCRRLLAGDQISRSFGCCRAFLLAAAFYKLNFIRLGRRSNPLNHSHHSHTGTTTNGNHTALFILTL